MAYSDAVVSDILEDLKGRSGFGDIWDGLDRETKLEIKRTWTDIVEAYNTNEH